MDNAVALVDAYLYVNGYFTFSEYPVIEAVRHGDYRVVTDVDILALLEKTLHGRHTARENSHGA